MQFLLTFTIMMIFSPIYGQHFLDQTPQIKPIPAFPSAEGFGKYTSGGRGGLVYIVSNLNDSGQGSLRWALEAKGPRIVVFEISGTIELNNPIYVKDGNLTIAGQTAPGDGITLKNFPLRIRNKDNIIIRFIRFRMGDLMKKENDVFEAQFCTGLMVDHCSFSWGIDETLSIYNIENATVQNSIIAEGLNDSYHSKGPHGFGSLMAGNGLSLYQNLWSHFTLRMPSLSGMGIRGIIDIRNNVFYNWEFRPTNNGPKCTANIVGNYYKPGPATIKRGGSAPKFFFWPSLANQNPDNYGKFYLEGNILYGRPEINSNQWMGVTLENNKNNELYLERLKNKNNSGELVPFYIPDSLYSRTLSAQEAFEKLLTNVGASLVRDSVDERIIHEVRTGTTTYKGSKTGLPGIIDSQEDVGGWPELKSLPAPKDSDRDGMPDEWEIANGLDPERRDDRFYDLHPHYTNLEVYLNSLVEHIK